MTTFKALLATNENGKLAAAIQQVPLGMLPPGEVLVRVRYSSLNYKDGLAVTGKPGVIRMFPMVPGVDFAGVVEESTSAHFNPGDEVVVTGCGTSEVFWGGYSELARLDQEFRAQRFQAIRKYGLVHRLTPLSDAVGNRPERLLAGLPATGERI